MDEGTKTIALGPRSRKAMTGDGNQNCVVASKTQNRAETVQDTDKLIPYTQSRRRKTKTIMILRDDEDPDFR
eukprot:1304792-Pyramimonas_sp.AAC.1